jgi:hypothetical protein
MPRLAKLCTVLAAIAAAAAAGPARAAPGDRLDPTSLGALLYRYDFDKLPRLDTGCSDPRADFVTQYCGEGPVNGKFPRTHGEHQCYSDPGFNGVNPFRLDPRGGLTIRAERAPPGGACFGSAYTSGMLSTRNRFHMRYGYWEVEAQMPKGGEARWPAIWLVADKWPPEIDFAEFAGGVLHGSQHSARNPQPGVGSRAPELGCFCDRAHRFGVLVRPDVIVWYADGREWLRAKPEPGVAGADYFLIANLAIHSIEGWTGPETPTSVPAELRVVSLRAWGLKP